MKKHWSSFMVVFMLFIVCSLCIQADVGINNRNFDLSIQRGITEIKRGTGLIYLSDETIDPVKGSTKEHFLKSRSLVRGESGLYLVQFTGPITEEFKSAVVKKGVELGDYIPEYSFLAKMSTETAEQIQKLSFVKYVARFNPYYKISKEFKDKNGSLLSEKNGQKKVRVRIKSFNGKAMNRVAEKISSFGFNMFKCGANFVESQINLTHLVELALDDDITYIDLVPEFSFSNDRAAAVMGAPTAWNYPLTGNGQIIGVCDSGIDTGVISTLHADFQGRIKTIFALGRTNDASDPIGHGTHVIGSIVGAGANSGGQFKGLAYDAQVVVQSVLTSSGGLNIGDIGTILGQAYNEGARIHSNSWTSNIVGYNTYSNQVDTFTWNNRDMVVLFSAGNYGDYNGDGVTDYNTVTSPGTAKNCITVGASENSRSEKGGLGDNINDIAYFSSRGNPLTQIVKPDVVAPGTWVISPKSSLAPDGFFNEVYNSYYAYLHGASMSTALTAGAVTLVRQFYMENKDVIPSASLTKATLINFSANLGKDRFSQGWGRVNLNNILATPIQFANEETALTTNASKTYYVKVTDTSKPLRFTLTWTDYPGSPNAAYPLVNDLDLVVQAPNGNVFNGNDFTAPYNDSYDGSNNVENVFISNPIAGVYKILVYPYNVPYGPQPFSLVASGGLSDGHIQMNILANNGSGLVQTPRMDQGGYGTTVTPYVTIPAEAINPMFLCSNSIARGSGPDVYAAFLEYTSGSGYKLIEGNQSGIPANKGFEHRGPTSLAIRPGTVRIKAYYDNQPNYVGWDNQLMFFETRYSYKLPPLPSNANKAPVLDPIGNKTVMAGQLLQFTLSASDHEGDPLTYSAGNLPAGAKFNGTTGQFSWTPGTNQIGTYVVHFEVSDSIAIDSEDVIITVGSNGPPVFDPIGDKSVNEGEPLMFSISATDPDGDVLTYSAANLPIGASFSPNTQTFDWTPGYDQAGSYPVTFQVNDGIVTVSETVTLTVSNVNRNPILAAIEDKTVTAGNRLQFTVTASDPDGDDLILGAAGLPDGAVFDSSTGKFDWTPAASQVGVYTVTFTASDGVLIDAKEVLITVN